MNIAALVATIICVAAFSAQLTSTVAEHAILSTLLLAAILFSRLIGDTNE